MIKNTVDDIRARSSFGKVVGEPFNHHWAVQHAHNLDGKSSHVCVIRKLVYHNQGVKTGYSRLVV